MTYVAGLRIYPVKGLRGYDVDTAVVERCGLAGDRRWVVLGSDGRALTQRDLPGMARIDARYDGDGLRLECAGHGGVGAFPEGDPTTVDVWRTIIPVQRAGVAASAWLSRVLGVECVLGYQANPASRAVTPDLAKPGDVVSLADGFPLLVTSEASLDDLNSRLERPVPMDRFRPNLVIAGAAAWAEDGWSHVQAGAIRLRLASPCSRCKVTTLDQQTGENPARTEPLKTLGTFHRDAEGRITFGWNAVPETLGIIKVGDTVEPSLHR